MFNLTELEKRVLLVKANLIGSLRENHISLKEADESNESIKITWAFDEDGKKELEDLFDKEKGIIRTDLNGTLFVLLKKEENQWLVYKGPNESDVAKEDPKIFRELLGSGEKHFPEALNMVGEEMGYLFT